MRDGWTRVAFGDVARNITDRVDNPAKAGVDRYVGLEHLGSESLTISRWGLPTDVAATKLLFRRGDIILGRRRVYQRKLAVADFDGICSAHALVLRARSEAVDPDFLPYFMQTDSFMDRALQISVGSLSPTINWTALAREEFSLPPLATQRRLAGALSALDRAVDAVVGAMTRGHIAGESRLKASITGSRRSLRLGDATIAVEYGCSLPASDTPQGTPILRIPNVLRGELDLVGLKRLELSPDEVAKYAAHEGDILMVRTNG